MKKEKITKNIVIKIIEDVIFIILGSFAGAVAARVFTENAQFAPAGLQGVCFMLQKVSNLSVDIWGYIINIPLIIIGYFFLKRKYVIYTLLNIVLLNLFIMMLRELNMPIMEMELSDVGTRLLCAFFAGVLFGVMAGFMLKVGGSTGGLDVPSCIIASKFKGLNVEMIINGLCLALIGISYLAYQDFISVLLSLVQITITMIVTGVALRGSRKAFECKIITKCPDEVKDIILNKMKHSATIVSSKGGYSNEDNTTIMAVINIREISTFLNHIQKVPHTFTYYTEVSGLLGNFRWRKEDAAK